MRRIDAAAVGTGSADRQAEDRTAATSVAARPGAAAGRSRVPRGEPKIDFTEISDRATRCQVEALRKFSPLFHLIDRGVGKRHEFAQLRATDNGFGFNDFNGHGGKHDQPRR